MKFNVFFTVKGPGGTLEVANGTNPVDIANLSLLLNLLSKPANLPTNPAIGLETLGIRVEPVAGGEADEFDPSTGDKLTGKTVCCCNCACNYPSADLLIRGEVHCGICRVAGSLAFKRRSEQG